MSTSRRVRFPRFTLPSHIARKLRSSDLIIRVAAAKEGDKACEGHRHDLVQELTHRGYEVEAGVFPRVQQSRKAYYLVTFSDKITFGPGILTMDVASAVHLIERIENQKFILSKLGALRATQNFPMTDPTFNTYITAAPVNRLQPILDMYEAFQWRLEDYGDRVVINSLEMKMVNEILRGPRQRRVNLVKSKMSQLRTLLGAEVGYLYFGVHDWVLRPKPIREDSPMSCDSRKISENHMSQDGSSYGRRSTSPMNWVPEHNPFVPSIQEAAVEAVITTELNGGSAVAEEDEDGHGSDGGTVTALEAGYNGGSEIDDVGVSEGEISQSTDGEVTGTSAFENEEAYTNSPASDVDEEEAREREESDAQSEHSSDWETVTGSEVSDVEDVTPPEYSGPRTPLQFHAQIQPPTPKAVRYHSKVIAAPINSGLQQEDGETSAALQAVVTREEAGERRAESLVSAWLQAQERRRRVRTASDAFGNDDTETQRA